MLGMFFQLPSIFLDCFKFIWLLEEPTVQKPVDLDVRPNLHDVNLCFKDGCLLRNRFNYFISLLSHFVLPLRFSTLQNYYLQVEAAAGSNFDRSIRARTHAYPKEDRLPTCSGL